MLVFLGLGMHDERDITLRGLEEARSSDLVFAEFYTSKMSGLSLEKLESLIDKKIAILARRDIEENAYEVLLKHAKSKKVALLAAGDPLISTTHVQLRIEAKKLGIETKVVHNASILSAAISLSGLHNYKFGRSATIALPEKGFFPETPYEVIKENQLRGLHTLLFLDIKAEKNKLLTANEAIEILLQIEEKRKEKIVTDETLIVVLGNVGSQDYVLRAGKIKDLRDCNFGAPPHTLIIPGKLHFVEEEYLREFAGLAHKINFNH